jgi:leader peptidase (prepilin peptidase)/N-methyltransferase
MDAVFIIINIVIFSLLIGSFLTACIYRLPRGEEYRDLHQAIADGSDEYVKRKGEVEEFQPLSINSPKRSFCPKCGHQLAWWDNIPLFSWLYLRGACAYCKTPISVRYPLVEVLSVLMALLSYSHFGLSLTALVVYFFAASLIVISFIDYDYYIIPDEISIGGTIFGFIIASLNSYMPLFERPLVEGAESSLLGLLLGGGFLYGVAKIYLMLKKVDGLGFGDVKLLCFIGSLFGPTHALTTILLGSLIGTFFGIGLILFSNKNLQHPIPFGPYLAIGALLSVFAPENFYFTLLDWRSD